MIRALALDLDDTLFLEGDFVRSAFRAVDHYLRQRLGEQADWFAELWRDFQTGRRGRTFDRVLDAAGVPASSDLVAELVRCYREHRPDIRAFADVAAALRDLGLPRDRVGVITDGPVVMQQNKFEALDLSEWVGHVICTDAWGLEYRKPHPRAFIEFERRTGCPGTQCAYVADNPAKDFSAPHERLWRTVRIRRPGGLHEAEPSAPGEVDAEAVNVRSLRGLLMGTEN